MYSNHITNTSFSNTNKPNTLLNYNNHIVDPSSLLSHFPSPLPPPPPSCGGGGGEDDEEEVVVNELTWQQLYDDLFFHHHHHQYQQHEMITSPIIYANNNNNNNMGGEAQDILKKEEEEGKGGNNIKRVVLDHHYHHNHNHNHNENQNHQHQITTTSSNSKKRCSKKDRHSKINTAHGPRDRRMRLSLEVARKFFDLQDTLGFDKASKTVEWLLIQSSSSIKKVMGSIISSSSSLHHHHQQQPSISEGTDHEGVSGIIDDSINENQQIITAKKKKKKSKNSINDKSKPKIRKQRRTNNTIAFLDCKFARESRKMARERARKRTIEKKRLILTTTNTNTTHMYAPDHLDSHHHHDSLVITEDWNTSPFSNFHQISHENQFTDFDRSLLY